MVILTEALSAGATYLITNTLHKLLCKTWLILKLAFKREQNKKYFLQNFTFFQFYIIYFGHACFCIFLFRCFYVVVFLYFCIVVWLYIFFLFFFFFFFFFSLYVCQKPDWQTNMEPPGGWAENVTFLRQDIEHTDRKLNAKKTSLSKKVVSDSNQNMGLFNNNITTY